MTCQAHRPSGCPHQRPRQRIGRWVARTNGPAPQPGTIYFVHDDHLSTPKAVTSLTGDPVWLARHQPFGQVVELCGGANHTFEICGNTYKLRRVQLLIYNALQKGSHPIKRLPIQWPR